MGNRLEVLEYFDNTNRSLIHRIPQQGSADIKYGAQLIVQESQEAVFFRDGKAMDTFSGGRYTLTTANVPYITSILTIPWEKSPFTAQVYFVGKQTFLDQKWGTRQPITLRDADFGIVRLRSFGKYSFRVTDAPTLINTLAGTQGKYTTDEVSSFLKDLIVSRLTDLLGTMKVSMLDLPAKFDEVAAATRIKVGEEFAKYGLELVDFFINAISPPEEVQKAIDARSSMGAIGDLNSYTMYQAANSMNKMAEQGGGGEGGGAMSMGMGAGFGMMMPQMMQQAMQARGGQAPGQPMQQQPQAPQQQAPPQQAPQQNAAGAAAAGAAGAAAGGGGFDFGELSGAVANAPKTPQDLVRSVIDASGWKLDDSASIWRVEIPVGSLRKQSVSVNFDRKDDAGHGMIAYSSVCGPVTEKNAMALLRYNTRLVHGAFAVQATDAGEMIVVAANHLTDSADAIEVTRVLTAIAWQADKAEEQLTGKDEN